MQHRSSCLNARPSPQSLQPSVSAPEAPQYAAYSKEFMNDEEYFNCCCGKRPDYCRLICCDNCKETWSCVVALAFVIWIAIQYQNSFTVDLVVEEYSVKKIER